MIEIEERILFANGLESQFKWASVRHNNPLISNHYGIKLLDYYEKCNSTSFYPADLFNDNSITRCSSFRIKYLHKDARKKISLDLIKRGHIFQMTREEFDNPKFFDSIPKGVRILPKMAKIWFDIFFTQFNRNPGHEPVLDKILRINNSALASEVPVWTTTRNSLGKLEIGTKEYVCFASDIFTGHIDLLLYNEMDGSLIVADYKPENKFLTSLPQVATYGLMMQRILSYTNVTCVSFSRDKLWMYRPEIIRNIIPKYIQKYGNPDLPWRDIIPYIL